MTNIEMLEKKLNELENASYDEKLTKLFEVAAWAREVVKEAKHE